MRSWLVDGGTYSVPGDGLFSRLVAFAAERYPKKRVDVVGLDVTRGGGTLVSHRGE